MESPIKTFIYLITLLLSSTAFAQTIHVQQLEEKFDVKELGKNNESKAEIQTLKALSQEKNTKELPSIQDINALLKNAGLESEAKNFDPLDKDQLYLRAGYFDIDQLAKLYPKSTKENLKKFIELVLLEKKTRAIK